MCFSPQRRAFFRHLNFKKCSRTTSFLTFSLPHVLLATAACIFSTSGLTKVLRTRHVLHMFTSKCAFRHSGVEFLISPLTTWLRTRRFNRPTFRLTRHTNHCKNTPFRDFSNIWRGCIFFLLTFALLHLLSADLTTLLCFSTVHIVGSFYLNFLRWYPAYIVCSSSVPYFKSIQKHWSLKLSSTGVLVVERHLASFPLSTSLGTWSYSSLLQAWKAGQHLCPSPEDVHQRVCKSEGSFEGSSFEHHLPASSLKVRLKKVKNDDGVCIFPTFLPLLGMYWRRWSQSNCQQWNYIFGAASAAARFWSPLARRKHLAQEGTVHTG